MWGAGRASFIAGKGAGSSSGARSGCRRFGIGFGASAEVAGAAPMDEVVESSDMELSCSHASARDVGGRWAYFHAHNMFGEISDRQMAHRTSVMTACEMRRDSKRALTRFSDLRKWVVEPDEVTLSSAIRECGLSGRFGRGMSLHCLVIKLGYQDQLFVMSNLITMYSKCVKVELARRVFDEMSVHDTVSWNSMVASYLRSGQEKEAICMFSMVLERVYDRMVLVNHFTLSGILRACATWVGTKVGRSMHSFVLKLNFEWDVVVMGSLMDMYAKHGSLGHARLIFEKMEERDVIAWNSLISGYAQCSHEEEAIRVFQKMQLEGFLPNEITFTSILGASAGVGDADLGRCLHANVTKCGYISDLFVGTALVDMYSKCLEMDDAERAFVLLVERNLVSFNALITGYGLIGQFEKALQAYIQVQINGMRPDQCTFAGVLSSCSLKSLYAGTQVHCHIVKLGLDSDISVGNSLVGFYAKCNQTGSAATAFECIFKPNAVCWAGIISSYVQNNEGEKALMYFKKMHAFSKMPDEFSFSAIFKACC